MPTVPILKTRNYFINSEGSVTKIEYGKEVVVKAFRGKKSKDIFVCIDKKDYNLLYLMIQHFIGDVKTTDKVRFTVNKDLQIPLNSIKVKPAIGKQDVFSIKEEAVMYNHKCDLKAYSANARAIDKITAYEVYLSLTTHNFKCVYCGDKIMPNQWHLDHFQSISTGGLNVFENIVPSCNICNIFKGAMNGNQFYALCGKVFNNYMFKEGLETNNKIAAALLPKKLKYG